MRRKRRRPERAEEGRRLMSNSLLDDLITPSHLATGRPTGDQDVGEDIRPECHGTDTNSEI